MELPNYTDLPIADGLPPRSAWHLWGAEDQVGTINLLTAERVRRALTIPTDGKVFSLNWDLEQPFPAFYNRGSLEHHIAELFPNIMDDSVDSLYPQASSQWDGLSHVGHPEYGYYNGRVPSDFTGLEGTKNGIEHWARRGIVGRGVLLDMQRFFEARGQQIGRDFLEFSPEDLEAAASAQNVEFEVGDILVIRTGWMAWYMGATEDEKNDLALDSINRLTSPGLASHEGMAEWLWNRHFSAVAADNTALEAWPHKLEVDQYLHFRLIALLGMAIGEMWFLEDLADYCASRSSYEFMLTSAPLNLRGGAGSPPNALALM